MENIMKGSPNGTYHHKFPNTIPGDVMFLVGLFISQTNRRHPLPLILPHVTQNPVERKEKRGLVSERQ